MHIICSTFEAGFLRREGQLNARIVQLQAENKGLVEQIRCKKLTLEWKQRQLILHSSPTLHFDNFKKEH